jgi:hypothetical protein
MSLTKLTLATVVVLAVGLFGTLLTCRSDAVQPASQKPAADYPAVKSPCVVLKWKFEKDRPFYQEMTTTTRQELTVQGNLVRQEQSQTFYYSWTPTRQENDNWTLKQKCLGVKLDLDIGGNKIQFDSTKEEKARNPLAEFYKALVGFEFAVTLDKEGKPPKVENREEFMKKINTADKALTNQILSEAALRRIAETCFSGLPEGPVQPGDSWTRKSVLEMGSLASYRTTYKYTYKGTEGKFDKIGVESTLEVLPPAEGGGALAFKFKDGKGKSGGAGVLLFDRDKGRVESLELTWTVEGVLTPVGRTEDEVAVSQTQTLKLRTTDTNPLPGARAAGDAEEIRRLREENERLRKQLKAVQDALRGTDKSKD